MAKRQHSTLPSIEDAFSFWDVLTPDERSYIASHFTVHYYEKNEIIYNEGDNPTHLMVLVLGKIKVLKSGMAQRTQIMRMLKPYENFGYRAIISNEPNSTTVAAFESSVVYMIEADLFLSILRHNNAFCYRFLEELATNLAESDSRTVNLTQKHIRGRLAESLIFLKQNYGLEDDGATINIYLSREDLANHSNMTTSNAIRTLTNFVAEELISVDGRKIKIINEEQLIKISKSG